MKLLIAGGGTGGHVFPALAVAERLRGQNLGDEVLFVGTARGLEAKVVPGRGFSLETIDIKGFMGKSWGEKVGFLGLLVKSVGQSLRILRRFRPEAILGVGGYASAPVLLAGTILGIPYLIQEQNAVPGAVNALLGRWAARICLSFPDAEKRFPASRTLITGNPVRSAIAAVPELPEGPPLLLVFGGSQGARALNEAMVKALPYLEGLRGSLSIRHQTGSEECETVRAGYRKAGWDEAEVAPFIDDMAAAYAHSHLVLCRAGATTVAELAASGRPAVLIPFPQAAGDHQTFNARALEASGAALLLPQSDLTPERLATTVRELLGDRERLQRMSSAMRSQAKPEAAAAIILECRAVAAGGRN